MKLAQANLKLEAIITNVAKIRAETDSTKLRQFLNNLPGDE